MYGSFNPRELQEGITSKSSGHYLASMGMMVRVLVVGVSGVGGASKRGTGVGKGPRMPAGKLR